MKRLFELISNPVATLIVLVALSCGSGTLRPQKAEVAADRESACRNDESSATSVWNPERQNLMRLGMMAGRPWAKAATEWACTQVARLSDEWHRLYVEACHTESTMIAGSRGLAQRKECLEESRVSLQELVAQLVAATDVSVREVGEALRAVDEQLRDCAHGAVIKAIVPPDETPDPTTTKRAASSISRARTRYWLGDNNGARELALVAQESAEKAGDTRLWIDALTVQAQALHEQGNSIEATAFARKARRVAEGTAHRIGQAEAALTLGAIASSRGDNAELLSWLREALKLYESSLGPNHSRVAKVLANLGATHMDNGDYSAARQEYERALSIRSSLNPTDIATADSVKRIGVLYDRMGEHNEAIKWHERARAILEPIFGDDHPALASLFNDFGTAFYRKRDYRSALSWYERGLAVQIGRSPDEQQLVITMNNIGALRMSQGDHESALEWFTKTLALAEKARPSDKPYHARYMNNLGVVFFQLGEHEKALEWFGKALEVYEAAYGQDDPRTANVARSIKTVQQRAHKSKQ